MRSRTSSRRYTALAIVLHWTSALCVLALVGMGLTMTHVHQTPMRQFQIYQWHKSVGITVLFLTVARLLWRLAHRPPPHPSKMPVHERQAASAAHVALYALLLGLPLTGWAVVSLSPFKIPTVLYGLVRWPHLPLAAVLSNPKAAEGVLKMVHAYGAWFLTALLVVHVVAALRHHLSLRDDVLRRMLSKLQPSRERF